MNLKPGPIQINEMREHADLHKKCVHLIIPLISISGFIILDKSYASEWDISNRGDSTNLFYYDKK